MSERKTDELSAILARKLACLSRMHELGVQQQAVLDAEDLGELLRLVAARQSLVEELLVLEQQLNPFRNESPESRNWPSPAARAAGKRLADECDRLLQGVLAQEQASERQLQARRDATAQQLVSMRQGGLVQQAYGEATALSGGCDLSVG